MSLKGTATVATIYENEVGGSAITNGVITTSNVGFFQYWVDEANYPTTQTFRHTFTGDKFKTFVNEPIIIFPGITASSSDTLTNKTIDTANNTITVIEADISDLGTAIALVADKLSVFAATTSAELASVLSDETGSGGGFVRATSPTIATPTITSGVLNTAISGTAFLDEDNMSSDSATKVASQQSIKKYVDDNTITLGTESTATGGSSIDFLSIPSGVKKITIMLVGISLSGTEELLIQIGTSGSPETSGYLSAVANTSDGGTSTAGFIIVRVGAAAEVLHGTIVLTLEDSANFTWVGSSNISRTDVATVNMGAGSKTLAAELDMIRVTQTGSDTFDANGGINIQYE